MNEAVSQTSHAANPTRLLVFGFGGHARSVADVALACGIVEMVFVDANARQGEHFFGHPVVAVWDQALPEGWHAFSVASDAVARRDHVAFFAQSRWPVATLTSRFATVGVGSSVGFGSLVAHHAHVGPSTAIGIGCIVNSAAVVEHDCTIGEFTHISVNATIAGRTKVGSFCMVGAGAVVIDGLEVADQVTIGAGAVVHRSIREPGVYVGNPARKINRKE